VLANSHYYVRYHAEGVELNKTAVTSHQGSGLVQTLVVSLATSTAVALLGVVLACWTWTWFAPRPQLRAPEMAMTDDTANGSVEMVSGLFGKAQQHYRDAAPAGASIRLLGIVAGNNGHAGYALMQLDDKDILALAEGDNVTSGLRLATVGKDHVDLEHNGTRETLTWPQANQ